MQHSKSILCLLLSLALFPLACVSQPGFKEAAAKPHVVFVVGDHEYSSEGTMPILAAELQKNYGMRTTVLKSFPDENAEENIPGLEALETADLAVFYLRWRRLPAEQLRHIENYLKSGRPIVGFRTSTHAFNYPKGHPLEEWNKRFGVEALGAPPGWGGGHTHYGHNSTTDVYANGHAVSHPVLKGVDKSFHVRSWLYHVLPDYPPKDATVLLMGRAVMPNKPAIDNPVAWTWKNPYGGRVFTTTIGHPDDFKWNPFSVSSSMASTGPLAGTSPTSGPGRSKSTSHITEFAKRRPPNKGAS